MRIRFAFPLLPLLCVVHGAATAWEQAKVAVITHEGGAHLGAYFEALADIREVGSVYLADPDESSVTLARQALGDKLKGVYLDHRELLAKEIPMMVLVSMEARLAPPVIADALEAGCHVAAEKPACVNLADFARLYALAEAKGTHLMLALANRVNPEVIEARRAIAEGRLGRIYALEMHLVQDQTRLTRPEYHTSWYADKTRAGGGHLAWLGVHWLDLAAHLLGSRIESVSGFTGNVGGQPINIEDGAAMAMRFENGALGTLSSGYYLDKGAQTYLRIWGSGGSLTLQSGPPPSLQLLVHGEPEHASQRPEGFAPYQDFLHAAVLASLGAGPPPITSLESLQALQAVFGLYEAAETGRNVTLAEDGRAP